LHPPPAGPTAVRRGAALDNCPVSVRLIVAVVAAAVALLLAVLLAPSGGGGASRSFDGAARPPGIPPQDFALRDEYGHLVRLSDFAGRPAIVAFLDSRAPTDAVLIAQQIRGALNELGETVPALAVSVDPSRDTRVAARRFLSAQSLLGRMHFLLGSQSQLSPIWRAFGIEPGGPQPAAAASVVLIDKAGRQRIGFPLSELTPEALAHDVDLLEAEPAPSTPPRREDL
jgi:protein SCO1/2